MSIFVIALAELLVLHINFTSFEVYHHEEFIEHEFDLLCVRKTCTLEFSLSTSAYHLTELGEFYPIVLSRFFGFIHNRHLAHSKAVQGGFLGDLGL